MKKLLSILLCIVFIFCLVSCQDDDSENTENPGATYVQDLNLAIKKNPTEYNGKQVTIKGYAFKYIGIYLTDLCVDGVADRYELNKNTKSKIEITITDDVLLSVLEDGDYIEVSGIVTIKDGKVYLDDCTYTMITTNEERK